MMIDLRHSKTICPKTNTFILRVEGSMEWWDGKISRGVSSRWFVLRLVDKLLILQLEVALIECPNSRLQLQCEFGVQEQKVNGCFRKTNLCAAMKKSR